MLGVKTTPWNSWSQGHQKTGHHEETCRNHLGGQLRHPGTGLQRGWKTSRWICLHNLAYCLKTNKSKPDRVQKMGLRIISGAVRSTAIQEMEKIADLKPLERRREVQSCHPRGKAEETDQSSTPPETSAWNKNRLKRKNSKDKLKDLQKENVDVLEADLRNCEELTSVRVSRKSLPEVRTEILGLAAKRTQAPELQKVLTLEMMLDRYPKSTWTHVFTDGSSQNTVRNGGSGAYISRSGGTTSSLFIRTVDLSSTYRAEVHAQKAAIEHLIEEDCNQQNIVLLSDSLSVLQFLTNGPTVLPIQQLHNGLCTLSNNNSMCFSGCQHMLALPETRLQADWQRQQQNSLNPTSPPHTKKPRPVWNRSRNQPADWKTMDMTHRKTRLTPLTGGPKTPSSVCVLITVG